MECQRRAEWSAFGDTMINDKSKKKNLDQLIKLLNDDELRNVVGGDRPKGSAEQ